ncbi:MAG: DegV family protein [Clostridia bacterium]|nr:DegV family protein [Clostridia bacterium]
MEIKRRVACTSTGCIEYGPERYKNHDIDIIRIHVHFKGKEYLEGFDLDPVKFYEELEALEDPKKNLPYTSMPTREEITACFDKAVNDGVGEMIVIALSSVLGGTYNLIRLIAEEYEGKIDITVIDSKITCFGEGMLAIKAAEMMENGVPTDQIIKEIHWMMDHQEFLGVDGKLDYLIYNGRLKGGKAFMGKMLNICPVVHFTHEGELCALQSVRTPKKALMKTCEVLKELIGDRDPKDYLLWHTYTGPSLIKELVEIEKGYGIETNHEAVIVSPVSGCHNGPWLAGYGLLFLRREDEPLED